MLKHAAGRATGIVVAGVRQVDLDQQSRRADVLVVGAGPAGSSAAYVLAQAGLDVLLLEKARFPREKVCGDGLTPRAVRQLLAMGVDVGPTSGWVRNRGLRILGAGSRLEVDWPELSAFPSYGLVRPRIDLDEVLAGRAAAVGARLHQQTVVTGPLLDERTGDVVGVTARAAAPGGERSREVVFRAPLVVAADGSSGRLALALGLERKKNRPIGVAVRTYFSSPRHSEEYLETWFDLWDRRPGAAGLLPGYGWVFPMGDGTCNVGIVVLTASRALDYRAVLQTWVDSRPAEWGLQADAQTTPFRGAALPAGFSRIPHYTRGVLLVGDAGGMVNPFSGEGISYAMESGRMAAEVVVQAVGRPTAAARQRALAGYPQALVDAYGGYYALARTFIRLIDHPTVMRAAVRRGLHRPALMRIVFKLLANLTDPRGDAADRVIAVLTRVARSG